MQSPIHAAANRLRGHLVKTPMLGHLSQLGAWMQVSPHVRVKAECLQTGGGAWFRGYLHFMLQSLGRYKGIVITGGPEQVLALSWAVELHRLPRMAVLDCQHLHAEDLKLWSLTEDQLQISGNAEEDAQRLAQELGFELAPSTDQPAVHDGLATLGLELADEMPADVERVVVPCAEWRDPVAAGLAAGGRTCETVSAPWDPPPEDYHERILAGLRLVPNAAGTNALHFAAEAAVPTCVVLS